MNCLFTVTDDNEIYLHLSKNKNEDTVCILSFKNISEVEQFVSGVNECIDEIKKYWYGIDNNGDI